MQPIEVFSNVVFFFLSCHYLEIIAVIRPLLDVVVECINKHVYYYSKFKIFF